MGRVYLGDTLNTRVRVRVRVRLGARRNTRGRG